MANTGYYHLNCFHLGVLFLSYFYLLQLQLNLVIKRSDITKLINKVIFRVPALYIYIFFYTDTRNLIYRNKIVFMVPRTSL